jgi:hypothetical protein
LGRAPKPGRSARPQPKLRAAAGSVRIYSNATRPGGAHRRKLFKRFEGGSAADAILQSPPARESMPQNPGRCQARASAVFDEIANNMLIVHPKIFWC